MKEALGDKDSKSKEDGLRQRDLQCPRERGCRSAEKKSFAETGGNGLMRQKKKKRMTEGGRCLRLGNAALRARVEGQGSRDSLPEKQRAQAPWRRV